MTIYFAGSEPDCLMGTFTVDTSGSYHDADYVRCGLGLLAGQSVSFALSAPVAAGFWLHWRYKCASGHSAGGNDADYFLMASDGSSAPVISTFNVVNGEWDANVYNDAGGYVPFYDVAVPYGANASGYIDVHYYQSGSDVVFDIYFNGSLVRSVTLAGTIRNAKSFTIASPNTSSAAGSEVYISEIIVADVDTRNLRVGTYYPSADGTHTNGTGSYADLDEIDTDGNAVTLAAVGDAQSVALTKHGTQPLAGVLAVAVNGLVASDGTNDLQAGLRISGTDYYSADLGVGATPEARSVVWNAHPGTSGNLPQDPSAVELIWKAVTPA